jgi:hypothetical protein
MDPELPQIDRRFDWKSASVDCEVRSRHGRPDHPVVPDVPRSSWNIESSHDGISNQATIASQIKPRSHVSQKLIGYRIKPWSDIKRNEDHMSTTISSYVESNHDRMSIKIWSHFNQTTIVYQSKYDHISIKTWSYAKHDMIRFQQTRGYIQSNILAQNQSNSSVHKLVKFWSFLTKFKRATDRSEFFTLHFRQWLSLSPNLSPNLSPLISLFISMMFVMNHIETTTPPKPFESKTKIFWFAKPSFRNPRRGEYASLLFVTYHCRFNHLPSLLRLSLLLPMLFSGVIGWLCFHSKARAGCARSMGSPTGTLLSLRFLRVSK